MPDDPKPVPGGKAPEPANEPPAAETKPGATPDATGPAPEPSPAAAAKPASPVLPKVSSVVLPHSLTAPPGAPSPSAPAPPPAPPSAPPPPRQSDWAATGGAIFFWLVVLAVCIYKYYPHSGVNVLLQIPQQTPRQISGVVLFEGKPVSAGRVQLVAEDLKNHVILGSAILAVSNSGAFSTQASAVADPAAFEQPLWLTANFNGVDNKDSHISGEADLYLNYSPLMGRFAGWTSLIVLAALTIFLITLFTGDLTRRKARLLFSVTYIMTILSLTLPIGTIILVSRNRNLVDMMESSPVGLVKGTARGVQNPQWLINLGGAVRPTPAQAPSPVMADPSPATPAATNNLAGVSSGGNPPPAASGSDQPSSVPGFAVVEGGLAVPFYVIMLAMLGGGINMTKKVPDIQKRYDVQALPSETQGVVRSALTMPLAFLGLGPLITQTQGQRDTVQGIRKELIDSYMGLISAPFLAIAVYYLLQIVATTVTEPILVIVSFATGFISDGLVTAITGFATNTLAGLRGRPHGGGHPGTPAPRPAP